MLAPGEGLNAAEWAANEFGGAPLGDKRLSARLVKSAGLLAAYPGGKIHAHPASGHTAISAFYRLIESCRRNRNSLTVVQWEKERSRENAAYRQNPALFRSHQQIAVNGVIAWRIMVMTLLARQVPDCSPDLLFTDQELDFLRDYSEEQSMPAPNRADDAVRLVAHLGYRDRKHAPGPGNQIM